jgi:hypothetical protein
MQQSSEEQSTEGGQGNVSAEQSSSFNTSDECSADARAEAYRSLAESGVIIDKSQGKIYNKPRCD